MVLVTTPAGAPEVTRAFSILQALARGVVEAARIPETTQFGYETLTPVAIYTQENVRATNRSEK